MPRRLVLSVNNSWNILNFRASLVRDLQRNGYEIAVVSPPDGHSGALAGLGVRHLSAAIDSKGLSPFADLRLFFRYLVLLRRERPDAYLAWTIKPNIYGSLAAHLLGIPVINNVSGLGTAFIRRTPITTLVSALYRLAFAVSSKVFFQNPDDRTAFLNAGLVDAGRTALLPGSGIDTERFAPAARAPDHAGPFVFLLIARLLRDKGVVEYVEAARTIRRDRADVTFRILGALDAENRSAIDRDMLACWVADGNVIHLGETDDVRPAIAAADCVVLPSYREGMPRSLLEGAALGKPLIATRVPGCIEIAREGENAVLCEVRDAHSLADAMRRMLALSDAERAAMGTAGRAIAVREFDERIVFDRYRAALDAALGDRSEV